VSGPRAPGHLEIRVAEPEGARLVRRVARADGIELRVAARRGHAVAYTKSKPAIRDLLAHLGAHDAVLSLDEADVISRTRERVNRATNCDEANLARQGAAARAQAEAIAALELDDLDAGLRQVATLRLRHPDLSLAELGRRARPPLPKSTVAGRMRALTRAAGRSRS
jgi:DNA-binding protein WhiA